VHLGDVIIESDDLLGDGVNIAARLEQLCPPGGVLISAAAHEQLGQFRAARSNVGCQLLAHRDILL
jgi:class 3 adenylate cyclase